MIELSLIFLMLAAICNAIMDTSVHHYSTSILNEYNPIWWDGSISWKNKYIDGDFTKGRIKWFKYINKPVQLTDAFHFFKMLMIIFICLSIITFDKCSILVNCEYHLFTSLIVLSLYGLIWNVTFSFIYKILRIEKTY